MRARGDLEPPLIRLRPLLRDPHPRRVLTVVADFIKALDALGRPLSRAQISSNDALANLFWALAGGV